MRPRASSTTGWSFQETAVQSPMLLPHDLGHTTSAQVEVPNGTGLNKCQPTFSCTALGMVAMRGQMSHATLGGGGTTSTARPWQDTAKAPIVRSPTTTA